MGFENKVIELCEVKGKPSDETIVQGYFKRLLLPNEKELFRPEPELIEYVHWLRDQWFVVMPETQDHEREAMETVDATFWHPLPERRKPLPQHVLPIMLGPFGMGEREQTGDDFYTNPIVISAARELMGRIDLDPASHPIANKTVRATRFFQRCDNGLNYPWGGKVWLNPPFSEWSQWVGKTLNEWASGRIEEMCVLAAMRTLSAQYFAPLLECCGAMCVIRGRLRFGGKAGESPDDGHAIFYFGERPAAFKNAFQNLGSVFYGSKA